MMIFFMSLGTSTLWVYLVVIFEIVSRRDTVLFHFHTFTILKNVRRLIGAD